MKKTRILILVAVLLIFLSCGGAFAADSEYSSGYCVTFYTDANTEISIHNYINQLGDFTVTEAPSLKGYDFAGWTDGVNIYQPGDVISVNQNLEFHALWTRTHPFDDIDKNDTCFADVMYVYEQGLMTGTSASSFSPESFVTRSAIWTVLGRIAGEDVDGGSPWYAKAQSWAIRTSVSDGTAPNREITRQELAAMLYREAGSPAVSFENWESFFRSYPVADWAQNAMCWALKTGVIAGDKLQPTEPISRAELASSLACFCRLETEAEK